jgi:hypothetical protein
MKWGANLSMESSLCVVSDADVDSVFGGEVCHVCLDVVDDLAVGTASDVQ